MQELTPEGLRLLDDVARRHGVSSEAVLTLLRALAQGGGTQAQFSHPELGGMGQWSQGGMIMVGDMFNQGLKHRVDMLCSELSNLLRSQPLFNAGASQQQSQGGSGGQGVSLFVAGPSAFGGRWWPADLGAPASTGAQNDLRYAYFPTARRLAIQQGGQVRVYDCGQHQISGFSQQQSGDQSLTFTSQFGLVRVADLPLLASGVGAPFGPHPQAPQEAKEPIAPNVAPACDPAPPPASAHAPFGAPAAGPAAANDILATLERLAELRQKNILSEEEFAAKKSELLRRL